MEQKKIIFSKDLLEAMNNSMETTETYEIERATPIVIFKGIMDLDISPLYDFISNNTYYDSTDLEMAFQDAIDVLKLWEEEEEPEEPEDEETEEYYLVNYLNGNKLFYTKEVAYLVSRAIQIAQEEQSEEVKLEYLLNAIAENIPKDILTFLRNLGINVKDFKKTFSERKVIILSPELSSFMKVLNEKYEPGTRCSILGRDKECEIVWKTMQKKDKKKCHFGWRTRCG